jgi:hypothetical protein
MGFVWIMVIICGERLEGGGFAIADFRWMGFVWIMVSICGERLEEGGFAIGEERCAIADLRYQISDGWVLYG